MTIGAYGFEPEQFFGALQRARVDVFLDVRQRRGMRGSRYAFANSSRLQAELEVRGIAYRHLKDLAPDASIRDLQRNQDAASGTTKTARTELAPEFIEAYEARRAVSFDWKALLDELSAFRVPALFCVERSPSACHRSLVAEHLARVAEVDVEHVVP